MLVLYIARDEIPEDYPLFEMRLPVGSARASVDFETLGLLNCTGLLSSSAAKPRSFLAGYPQPWEREWRGVGYFVYINS